MAVSKENFSQTVMANLNHLADFNDSRNSWKLAPLTSKL